MKVQTLKDILSDFHPNDDVEILVGDDHWDVQTDRVSRYPAEHPDGTGRNDLWLEPKGVYNSDHHLRPEWNTQENYNRLLANKVGAGSFEHALIECFFKADNNNKVALVNAFPSYFIPKPQSK
jgi:hypothetical protein